MKMTALPSVSETPSDSPRRRGEERGRSHYPSAMSVRLANDASLEGPKATSESF